MNCEQIAELIPGYALDALDLEERMLVEMHLAQCPECQAELEALRPVASSLAFVAEVQEPSAQLRERIRADLSTPHLVDAQRVPGRHQPRGKLIPFPAWALAAAAVFIGLIVWNVMLQLQIGEQRERLEQQAEIVTMLALAEKPGVVLQGTEAAPGAKGRLVPSPNGEGAALVVQDMPPPPPGRIYQLWLIRPDGQRDNGGLFTVDEGRGMIYIHPPANLSQYVAVGVTDEPPGGSPGPTGTKVLGGKLRSRS